MWAITRATSLLPFLGMMIIRMALSCLKNSLLIPTLAEPGPARGRRGEEEAGGRKAGRWASKVDCFVGWMRTLETLPREGTRSSRDPFGSLG